MIRIFSFLKDGKTAEVERKDPHEILRCRMNTIDTRYTYLNKRRTVRYGQTTDRSFIRLYP